MLATPVNSSDRRILISLDEMPIHHLGKDLCFPTSMALVTFRPMTASPFSTTFHEPSSTLLVVGDIEARNTADLGDAIAAHTDNRIIVDLSAVTYLPSRAIGVLVVAMRRAEKTGAAGFEIVAAQGSVASAVLTATAIPHRHHR